MNFQRGQSPRAFINELEKRSEEENDKVADDAK